MLTFCVGEGWRYSRLKLNEVGEQLRAGPVDWPAPSTLASARNGKLLTLPVA